MPVLLGASHSCRFFVHICTRVVGIRNVSSSQQAVFVYTANFAVIRCRLIVDGHCYILMSILYRPWRHIYITYSLIHTFQVQSSLPPAQARAGFQWVTNSSSCSTHDTRHYLTRRDVHKASVAGGDDLIDTNGDDEVDRDGDGTFTFVDDGDEPVNGDNYREIFLMLYATVCSYYSTHVTPQGQRAAWRPSTLRRELATEQQHNG
jgi:hypothetical protein